MESTSDADTAELLRPRMPDGTVLIARQHDPPRAARAIALLLPDLGERIDALDGAAALLAQQGVRAIVPEHRGHGHSGGTWTLNATVRDYRAWITTLRAQAHERAVPLLVIARGLSASIALLHEELAHRHAGARMPALPDAMLLLEPVSHGSHRAPRGIVGALVGRVGACRAISRRERGVLHRFRLPPVRVQTPTTVLVSGPLAAQDPHDPLRRIFGNARVRRVTWLHPTTRLALARADKETADAALALLHAEKPHRFHVSHRAP